MNASIRSKSASTLPLVSPDDPENILLEFQRSTQRQMDAMNQAFNEQMTRMASLVQVKEEGKDNKRGLKKEPKKSDSLENPPPPPPSAHSGKSRAKQREAKEKFNGGVKNYKDGAKRQRASRKIELELAGATAVDGPDVLYKMKTLGYAIIKDYDKLRVPGSDKFESLFAEGNKPTMEQAMFYDNFFPKPEGAVSKKKPQLYPMIF